MPCYPYRCPSCAVEFDIVKRISEFDRPEACPNEACDGVGVRVWNHETQPAITGAWFQSGYDFACGTSFAHLHEKTKWLKDNGMDYVGPEGNHRVETHKKWSAEQNASDADAKKRGVKPEQIPMPITSLPHPQAKFRDPVYREKAIEGYVERAMRPETVRVPMSEVERAG